MAYTHYRVARAEVKRYQQGITVTALAEQTGIRRDRLTILLRGVTETELEALEYAVGGRQEAKKGPT